MRILNEETGGQFPEGLSSRHFLDVVDDWEQSLSKRFDYWLSECHLFSPKSVGISQNPVESGNQSVIDSHF